jgi:glutathione peroxidase
MIAPNPESNPSPPASAPIAGIPFLTADGRKTSLDEYRGKVLLVVNIASKCGLISQYDQLDRLHASLRREGFSVIGFPADEFGSQEPGTGTGIEESRRVSYGFTVATSRFPSGAGEIQEFCTFGNGVTFPVFAKISVKGPDIHPLYQWLTAAVRKAWPNPDGTLMPKLAQKGLLGAKGEVSWNFEKFLIGRDGRVATRFAPDVAPDDPALLEAIRTELDKPGPSRGVAAEPGGERAEKKEIETGGLGSPGMDRPREPSAKR